MNIKLNDILGLGNLKDYKVRLNKKIDKYSADDVYFSDEVRYIKANAYNGKNKQLNRPYVITFAEYTNHKDLWIFTGIYKVDDYANKNKVANIYPLAKLIKQNQFQKFEGRAIVKFHKIMQSYVLNAEKILDDMELLEILNQKLDGQSFKSYYDIDLSFSQLEHIIKNNKTDWQTALQNCKAVYLIRDSKNGKLYVGSATSQNGYLWSRWSQYIKNGHGGNIKLTELVNLYGIDYARQNFYFSILENFTPSTNDQTVLNREYYWHKILQTNKFGYNGN